MSEMGFPVANRFAKSSRSSILATVVDAVSRRTSSTPSVSNHSELRRSSTRSRSITFQNWDSTRSAKASTSSFESVGRVEDLPDGSPTRAVKSPMIKTA